MPRPFLRPVCAATALLLVAGGLSAQAPAEPRVLLVPQIGAAVHGSRGSDVTTMASLAAELPLGRGWSLMAEGTMATTDYLLRACPAVPGVDCSNPTDLRSGFAAGVVARPLHLGPLEPYAGVSGGVARWARDNGSGTAPMTSLRAGVDLRVVGPFGARAELVRRVAWTGTPDADPLYADVFSLGASYALRR